MARNVETNSTRAAKKRALRFDEAHRSVLFSKPSAHNNQRQDDLYLQALHFVVGLWSGFSGGQWLCCATLGASVQHWGQNLFTFQVIYQETQNTKKGYP